MKGIIKDALVLFIITLVAGIALGWVYDITKEPIAAQNQRMKDEAYKAVYEEADNFYTFTDDELAALNEIFVKELGDNTANTLDEAALAKNAAGDVLGEVFTITNSEGYGGNIQMTVGVNADGTVMGVEILSISETPGLGLHAKDADFRNQFVGVHTEEFEFTKNKTKDNEIDAITSATYSTKSMIHGVNAALAAYRAVSEGGIIK